MRNDRELKLAVGGLVIDRASYLEYLENPEAEEAVIQVILDQGKASWLLSSHMQRDDAPLCAVGWCVREWPCVWWERATEAQRRAEVEAAEAPVES